MYQFYERSTQCLEMSPSILSLLTSTTLHLSDICSFLIPPPPPLPRHTHQKKIANVSSAVHLYRFLWCNFGKTANFPTPPFSHDLLLFPIVPTDRAPEQASDDNRETFWKQCTFRPKATKLRK